MTILALEEGMLPSFRPHDWDTTTNQLAQYFRKLLENRLDPDQVHQIELPSILELARIMNCCELDIFDALSLLKQQAYAYELHGIDAPVKLYDPLFRKPSNLKRSTRFKWINLWRQKKPMALPTTHVS